MPEQPASDTPQPAMPPSSLGAAGIKRLKIKRFFAGYGYGGQ